MLYIKCLALIAGVYLCAEIAAPKFSIPTTGWKIFFNGNYRGKI